jgi:uncharacterized cofD-like protein
MKKGSKKGLELPLRVVAIGGGTGLSTLLKGLKRYAHIPEGSVFSGVARGMPLLDITAIVTVSDDGGSSGRLRREFDVLPPGDIRNCMVALAEDEDLLTQLFQFRFTSGQGLKGHSFGNLFLAALAQITGDFQRAIQVSSEVLAIAGRIHPSTAANVRLRARLANGRAVDGESRISRSEVPIRSIELLPAGCRPLEQTLRAIEEADAITLGPGSLYTSVIPNLLVAGISRAIAKSGAVKACFVNLMGQPGETVGMKASEHVEALEQHAGQRILDYAIVNVTAIPKQQRKRYAKQQAMPVENDIARLEEMGLKVVGLPLLADSTQVRHDSERAAAIVLELAKQGRRRRILKARNVKRKQKKQ